MTPDQIVAFVLALTAPPQAGPLFPVIAAGGADPRFPVVATACPRPLAPFEIEGRTVACGKISVPEDHARPEGRRIDLAFMIFKSRSLSPAPDAVVHLHGGPGVGIVARASLTTTFFEHLRGRRDVVAFDQRGVDASAAAQSRCFDTLASDPEALVQATRGIGDRIALTRKMTRACLDEIAASGADITKINTWQNAQDVSAVMHTLGYPVYNIYGISYGTKLGQEVMRSASDGLRSVVLDSVAPVQVPIYDTLALPHAEAIQSIFDSCTADPKCAAAYPGLKARFWSLYEKLETQPIKTTEGTIDSEALFQFVDGRNNWKAQLQGLTGYVPKVVAELETGDATTFLALAGETIDLHPTPESALAGLNGLDPDAMAFAETALRLAMAGRQNDKMVETALARLEADRTAAETGAGLVDEFEAALLAAALALPDQTGRVGFAADYLRLRTGEATRAALTAMLARQFTGETLTRLQSLAGMLGDGQLAQVYARIGADNSTLDRVLLEGFQTDMFACQEDMDINSPAGAAAVGARLQTEFGWPESLTDMYGAVLNATFFDMCKEFTPQPRAGFHDPVTAAVPTLVMQGAFDTQTAPSWGALMVASLPKGRLVFFPESGHGTLAFSQCAKDIGAAFLENPEAPFDSTCTQALTSAFLLPDGTWSR
ncbi:alpha/beta fold hydrolase [Paragemmobacter straminiformis]|uniref:Alpha/beta fold hydrolase n=1 Tax=Paragemmobacter straminiformis TaxID=2045119 RepID=A0A842I9G0_9RHOB|nr:alpha/beta fold hydrolase [Gemmobacter straminiformis]MBC2836682.1 alpha/beta fold hydrolase [Gemmobacter straminiformis]